MIGFFGKKMSNIPVDNGSSFKALIVVKLTGWLINITITETETSLLLLYLLLFFSIRNPHLLCTSCGDSKICLPSLYILIKFSPNDQNTLKLFLSINKRTNIYISSYKFVMNGPILIDIQLIEFPVS
jgi:hypothetical protein